MTLTAIPDELTQLDDRVAVLVSDVRQRWAPPPKLLTSEFADREIVVPTGRRRGTRWRTDFAPYQRGIMDAHHEPGVEIVVVMGSSQWGKTSIALCKVAYGIANDPSPTLVVCPTVKPMAERFSKNRLRPLIAASPILRDLVTKPRQRQATNSTMLITYRGGYVAIAGANSAASLASDDIQNLILDEVDRYPLELSGEGNTVEIAIKRTTTYQGRRQILMLSSPTIHGGTIHAWYQRGDQRKYFVPCPACGCLHDFQWKQVRWTGSDISTARLYCPACQYAIDDAQRVAILSGGEWRPTCHTRVDPTVVSFHVWEGYSPLSSLTAIVGGFLRAREAQKAGSRSEMHTWQNTTLGEPVDTDVGKGVEPDALLLRRELIHPEVDVPAGACCLTLGVDVQDDRLEALVVGWGPGEESWVVERCRFDGDTTQPGPWRELDALLDRPFRHELGAQLMIHATCIDSAGHRTTTVYDYVDTRAMRRVYAIIGRAGDRPIVSSPSPKRWGRGERKVPLRVVGTDAAKSLVLSRLGLVDDDGAPVRRGPGVVHLPYADWCDHEFSAQLTSERLVTKWSKGIAHEVWVQGHRRNEMLDCFVYAVAALRILNPKLNTMAQALAAASRVVVRRPPDRSGPTSPAQPIAPRPGPAPGPARRVSRSGYLTR